MKRMHWTIWIVVFWLAAVALGLVAQAASLVALPLANLVLYAGLVTTSYLGLEQAGNAISSWKLTAGAGVLPPTGKYLALTLAWLALLLAGLVAQFLVAPGLTMPIGELVGCSGLVSAAYVAGNKANRLATRAGPLYRERPAAAPPLSAGVLAGATSEHRP